MKIWAWKHRKIWTASNTYITCQPYHTTHFRCCRLLSLTEQCKICVCVFVYVLGVHKQQHREESLSLSGHWLPSAMIQHRRGTNICTETQISQSPSHTQTGTHTHQLYCNCCSLTSLCLQAISGASLLNMQSAPVFSLTKRIHLKHFKHLILY